jgi:hypothetical protein
MALEMWFTVDDDSIPYAGLAAVTPNSETLNPEIRILNPDSRIPKHSTRIPKPESEVLNHNS